MPKLWKENRVDQEWELGVAEIATRFLASPYNTPTYLNHWPLERIVRAFLTSKDGLDSVFEESDYEAIHEAIRSKVFPSS